MLVRQDAKRLRLSSDFGDVSTKSNSKDDRSRERDVMESVAAPISDSQNRRLSALRKLTWLDLNSILKAPLGSPTDNAKFNHSSNSQALEIALCESALLADADSQFGSSTFYGLPLRVKYLLKKHRGIENLYDWQDECLNLRNVQRRRNLIYSLPTSGGKTLVAEILIWKEVITYEKDALLILPYVSIVQEKIRLMSDIADEMNFLVEEYAGAKGRFPPTKRHRRHSVYIATIEKAHSLVNSLLETNRISELGLVVVDELHMIGEESERGAILESLLTKLKFTSASTMIIGMSATLGNVRDLQEFLDAEVYSKDFRPVRTTQLGDSMPSGLTSPPYHLRFFSNLVYMFFTAPNVQLKEYLKIGQDLFYVNAEAKTDEEHITHFRTLNFSSYTVQKKFKDPDYLAGLVLEVIPDNSCLIFCPTKANCENVAKLLCDMMPPALKETKVEGKMKLMQALQNEGGGKMCPILWRTIRYGIAFHHSGLTKEERSLIEEAYSAGTISCLTCTSTLAAGVNLPAKRVIVRSPYVGTQFMTRIKLKQMIGRAGRAGIDSSGESILIIKPEECKKVKEPAYKISRKLEMVNELLQKQTVTCHSSLLLAGAKGLQLLLLSSIGLKLVKTEKDLVDLVSNTLLYVQRKSLKIEADLRTCVQNILNVLKRLNLIIQVIPTTDHEQGVPNSLESVWEVSRLGSAVFKGSVNIEKAGQLYRELKNGLKALVLDTYFHLLYLVVPYDIIESTKIDPALYNREYFRLSAVDLEVAKILGISEAMVDGLIVGRTYKGEKDYVMRRFYVAMILNELWQQKTVWQVAEKYSLPRGHIQNLLTNAASFGSCVLHFCQELEDLWAYKDLLPNFILKLSYCVNMELIPLMELPHVKRGRARQLYNAGFKNLNIIAQSKPEDIVKNIEHLSKKKAKDIVAAAQAILVKKAEDLQEEILDLVSGF